MKLPGFVSPVPSLIDNIRGLYRHWADDYTSPGDPSSCQSCTGGMGGGSDLPSLSIRRVHRYDLIGQPSSLGPGVFLAHDISLQVMTPSVIDIIDPQANLRVRFTRDATTGVWRNPTHNLAADVTISGGQASAGGTAVYTLHDGISYHFAFINDGSAQLRGRLVRHQDRNGNAISISYLHAPTASDADLGGVRSNLWKVSSVTDAHGLSAVMTYNQVHVAGRPVVSRIDLPNGSHIDYRYQQPALGFSAQDLVGFSGATLPGNDVVTVTATRDNGLVRIAFDDPGAEGMHRRKTVWLTEPGTTDPRSGSVASYRIREARLATGEIAYRRRLEQDGQLWQSIVQEGSRLLRIVHTAEGRVQRTDYATAWDWSQPTASYTWETAGTFTWDDQIRPTQYTDATGKVTVVQSNPQTNAPVREDYADGTYSTTTRGAFALPLSQRDRTGRIVTATYDAAGNRATETLAAETPEAATTQWTYNERGQITSETDPLGALTEYTYTPNGFLATRTEPPDVVSNNLVPMPQNPVLGVVGIEPADFPFGSRATWTFEYDAAGRRTATIDPRRHLPIAQRRTTFTWDDRNRLIATTYPDLSTETTVYGTGSDANLVVRTTDRNGRVTAYDYDDAGRVIATTLYANSQDYAASVGEVIESCLYLPGTTQTSDCWRNGERVSAIYDPRGRPSATTVWANATTSLTTTVAYDNADRPWLETDAFNRRTVRIYDQESNVVRTLREAVPGALPTTLPAPAVLATLPRQTVPNPTYTIEDMTYDAEGRLTGRVDGRGTVTTVTYNQRGDVINETIVDGQTPVVTQYGYDAAGRRVAVTSPRGVTTRTDYTLRGQILRVVEAVGSPEEQVTTERSYSATRKLRFSRNANGGISEYRYGGCCDRLLAMFDELQFETQWSYDAVGNRLSVMDPNTLTTTTSYDARNRVRTVANAVPETTETVYDDNLTDGIGLDAPGAQLTAYLPALSFAAGTADGAAVAVLNPLGETTYLVYDGLGRAVLRLEPMNRVTRMRYDQVVADTVVIEGTPVVQNLVATTVTDPLQNTSAQWVDGLGRARVQVDATGAQTRLGWDAGSNQIQVRDPNGVGWDAVYSARGFLMSRSDTRVPTPSTTTWAYDADGNRTAETVLIDGVPAVESYGYDLRGRRTALTDRIGGVTGFQFDAVGNLLRITDAEGGVTSYLYDERQLLKQETFPGSTGGTRSYTYDPGRRLITRTQQGAVMAEGN